jgi:2-succinyl-5-enolpyruvyl-6-hydroxy-3-cyclohexene-1-carboxylate synthase
VHLNFPLREPLAPEPEQMGAADWAGRPDGRPWTELRQHTAAPHADDVQELAGRIAAEPRGVIVCGTTAEAIAEPAARLAAASGWPLLAEPTSGVRCGPHDRSHVVAHYDVLLRVDRFASEHAPGLVLRVGDMPTSKPLRAWLAKAAQVVLDPHAAWNEPTRQAELLLRADAAPTLDALAAAVEMRKPARTPAAAGEAAAGGASDWLAAWRAADALVPIALADAPDLFEPKLLAGLEPELPDGAVVWLSSSMPVRDVEACFPSTPKRLRFLSNRGANGIDGVVSSAAGAALATKTPVWLLTGELALLHDIGGLLAARRAGAQLEIVCINNGGGAIFDFLPVADHADPALFEEHIATPSPLDLGELGAGIRELRTDRSTNVRFHRELVERVAARL